MEDQGLGRFPGPLAYIGHEHASTAALSITWVSEQSCRLLFATGANGPQWSDQSNGHSKNRPVLFPFVLVAVFSSFSNASALVYVSLVSVHILTKFRLHLQLSPGPGQPAATQPDRHQSQPGPENWRRTGEGSGGARVGRGRPSLAGELGTSSCWHFTTRLCLVPPLQALADALRVNRSITEVNLSNSEIGEEGFKARLLQWAIKCHGGTQQGDGVGRWALGRSWLGSFCYVADCSAAEVVYEAYDPQTLHLFQQIMWDRTEIDRSTWDSIVISRDFNFSLRLRTTLATCQFALLNQTSELQGQEGLFRLIQLEIIQGKFSGADFGLKPHAESEQWVFCPGIS